MLKNHKVRTFQIFFKAGILARLEDARDETLSKIITKFQAQCRGYIEKLEFKKREERKYEISKKPVNDNLL